MSTAETNLSLPAELADAIRRDAEAAGLSVPAFIELLLQQRSGRLDDAAADAAKFVFNTQAASLRKLAE